MSRPGTTVYVYVYYYANDFPFSTCETRSYYTRYTVVFTYINYRSSTMLRRAFVLKRFREVYINYFGCIRFLLYRRANGKKLLALKMLYIYILVR